MIDKPNIFKITKIDGWLIDEKCQSKHLNHLSNVKMQRKIKIKKKQY